MKSLRQDAKRTRRNLVVKAELDSMRVKLRKLMTGGKAEEAVTLGRAIAKRMDKAVSRGIFKIITAIHKKSFKRCQIPMIIPLGV